MLAAMIPAPFAGVARTHRQRVCTCIGECACGPPAKRAREEEAAAEAAAETAAEREDRAAAEAVAAEDLADDHADIAGGLAESEDAEAEPEEAADAESGKMPKRNRKSSSGNTANDRNHDADIAGCVAESGNAAEAKSDDHADDRADDAEGKVICISDAEAADEEWLEHEDRARHDDLLVADAEAADEEWRKLEAREDEAEADDGEWLWEANEWLESGEAWES